MRSSSCQGTYGHDATYWLKWTAGNDVRVRASGVGRRGWNVVCVGVCCTLHLSISYFPLFLSCTQIWYWVNNGFHHHDTPWTCSVVSVPTWMVFHSRSLSRLPMASPSTLPFRWVYEFTPAVLRTVRLQIVASLVPWNSKAVGSAPDQPATFPEKSLVRLLAVVVGDWC